MGEAAEDEGTEEIASFMESSADSIERFNEVLMVVKGTLWKSYALDNGLNGVTFEKKLLVRSYQRE